jgi:ADP-ribose pyrophosphatase YjhB (NUDIX family)
MSAGNPEAGHAPRDEHQHHHDVLEASDGPGFCPRCGTALVDGAAPGRPPHCPSCGFVRWENPKLAAGVVVEHEGAILLVRRNHEPRYGRWSFPSGFVDRGEVVEEAARREVLEETAVEVALDGLLGVYSTRGDAVVFIAYAGHSIGGVPQPGPEALEIGLFAPDQLPELAFEHDPAIIAAWERARGEPSP